MRENIAAFIERAGMDELAFLLATAEKKLLRLGRRGRTEEAGEKDASGLDENQLERLTLACAAWKENARTPAQRRSRGRVWLAFVLIRYGALRLSELFALDDRTDIDCGRALLRVGGPYARTVPMPADLMRILAVFLEDPMFCSLRGELTRIDPGYLRRKFYALAAHCDLPGDLLNPRALRQARGVELLGGGVPLPAVWNFMGRRIRGKAPEQTYFSVETVRRIVRQYLNREVSMKTSARNIFIGKITNITRDELLAEVELTTFSGLKLVAAITGESLDALGLALGRMVTASIKAPWVMLAEGKKDLKTSARNKFPGKVTTVKTSGVAAEVLMELEEGSEVCALVTRESVNALELTPGREVTALFKAFAVVLNAE